MVEKDLRTISNVVKQSESLETFLPGVHGLQGVKKDEALPTIIVKVY